MITFPNCKINLGLRILRKRNDGFHDLETVFYPLQLKDALEVIQTSDLEKSPFQFSQSGLSIGSEKENNLCVKAYHLLKNDFPEIPSLQMHLHKSIPVGAGLGGGSADGAFTLKLLNKKFDMGLKKEQLIDYASVLGSDCPFFIINKPCFASGRGEFLESIQADLSGYKIILVIPDIHISTAWAFTQITPALPHNSIKEIVQQPIETWKEELINDFEEPVFKIYAEVKSIKEELYKNGAVYAGMSGSGSGVYGIFKKEISVDVSFPSTYLVKESLS